MLTPDLPGHGDVPGPFTFDRAVAEVRRQIAAAPVPVHLCGLSLSVTVAVLTYLAEPERVRSLVLSGGVAHPPPLLAIQRGISAAMPERLLLSTFAGVLRRTIGGVSDEERAEMVAAGVADLRAAGKRTYLDALAELARTDLRDRLGQVTVPTLVLCGEQDRANLGGARELAAGIAGAQLRIVPEARHLWSLQLPDLYTQTVTGFVTEVSGG